MAVFDANVLAALIVDLPWSEHAQRCIVEHEERQAPELLAAELGNVICRNVRAGVLSQSDGEIALARALSLVSLEQHEPLALGALQMALGNAHSVYDCFYLVLAARRDTLLLTADRKLAGLAQSQGIATELLQ